MKTSIYSVLKKIYNGTLAVDQDAGSEDDAVIIKKDGSISLNYDSKHVKEKIQSHLNDLSKIKTS